MKFIPAMLAALLLFGVASAFPQSADEQYIRVYQTIQEADRLNEAGQEPAAAAKYLEARESLRRFQAVYPGWNDRVINYRLGYVESKLAPFIAKAAAGATNAPGVATATPATPPPAAATPGAPPPAEPVFPGLELQQQVAALQNELERVQAENRQLGAKLREALSAQPAAADPQELAKAQERLRALERENELLKVRAGTSTSAASVTDSLAEMRSSLAQQGETIVALRAENEVLKKQTTELQKRLDAQTAAVATNADQALARTLEERDGTIRKLNEDMVALQKEIALLKERERQAAASPAEGDGRLVETLRARLQALEAKPVPYTREELALLDKDGMTLAYANPATATPPTQPPPAEGSTKPRRISKEIPPGAGQLVREAERAFALRNYAEAERKYLDVLRQDTDNVSTLANLASTQLELGNLAEAEKNARRALELDPDDHFALYVMGRVFFRQDKLEEALDVLSRSAQANPEYPETQNYLGIVLSEKGLRVPAEAALRKAVQLQPGHAAAHNNLAVVYATQKPPALALARWHYQKALAAGHPKNPELEKLLEAK